MRYNEKELALKSDGKGQMEGRLNYKKINTTTYYYQSVFKERWYKLIDNFLFYFRITDIGKIEKHPSGVFVLENASIQMEHDQDTPFAFSISYIDEPEKRHMFSGMSESCIAQWVSKLRCASYEYLRSQLHILQSRIYGRTGKDPLLMVPRNEGSMKWAPGEPMPAEHHIANGNNFVSHLVVQQSSSHVVRSKSFISVLENVHISKKNIPSEDPWRNSSGLERSKTSALVYKHSRQNPFDSKEESSHVTLRPAPSPPARKKNSPQMLRNAAHNSTSQPSPDHIFDKDLIHPNSILSIPPRPPQRKNLTKACSAQSEIADFTGNKANEVEVDNLIEF